MRECIKNLILYLVYKTIGTISFIRRIEWRIILEWLNPKEDERILDVACGNGVLSLKIAEKGVKVHGVDLSENAINSAKRLAERERIACEFEVGDAEDLPYPDKYFDKVVCSSSLEHFNDDIKALREMNRVLKSDGVVVLTTDSLTYPISDELRKKHRTHCHVVNYYTQETLKERFEMAGFEIHRNKYLLNSRITSFFFKIGIKMRFSGILWMMISFIAHPLCLIYDGFFGAKRAKNKGYTLIAEARARCV